MQQIEVDIRILREFALESFAIFYASGGSQLGQGEAQQWREEGLSASEVQAKLREKFPDWQWEFAQGVAQHLLDRVTRRVEEHFDDEGDL